jgi:hypothetical protein
MHFGNAELNFESDSARKNSLDNPIDRKIIRFPIKHASETPMALVFAISGHTPSPHLVYSFATGWQAQAKMIRW